MGCMAEEAVLKLCTDFCGLPPELSVASSGAGVGCWGAGVTATEAVGPAGCIGPGRCLCVLSAADKWLCVLSRC